MSTAIEALEAELAAVFDAYPQQQIITSLPGLGLGLAARILGGIGDDPARFADTAGVRGFAGTAITRASGRSRLLSARHVCNRRLADACH